MSPVTSIHAQLVNGDGAVLQGGLPLSQVYQPPAVHGHASNGKNDSSSSSSTTGTTMTSNVQRDESEMEEDSLDNISLWEVVASLSMLFLWIQRSAFGFVAVLPSLVLVSHVCWRLCYPKDSRSITNSMNNTEQEESISWSRRYYFKLLQSQLLGQKTAALSSSSHSSSTISHHKQQVNEAWPPPGLVALAILTIVALVVHPDGMTWILLRKIRDIMVSILQSSSTCWAIMIRDYGVLGTVSASASILLVLVVAIIMHKTFLSNRCGGGSSNRGGAKGSSLTTTSAPSTNTNASNTGSSGGKGRTVAEKKRRRRKGHARGRSKAGNGGGSSNNNSSSSSPSPRLPKVEEVASDATGSDGSCRSYTFDDDASAIQLKAMIDEAKQSTGTRENFVSSCMEEEAASIMTSPSALESVVSVEEFEVKARTPVPSVCTVDTTSISDDISCSSFSVRSGVPPPPRPMRSVNTIPTTSTKGRPDSNPPSSGNKAKGKANQRGPKQSTLTNPSEVPMPNIARADGLKTPKPAHKHTISPEFSSHVTGESNNKDTAGGKGRNVVSQNARGGRSKGGGRHVTSKSHPKIRSAVRTVSPVPNTVDSTLSLSASPSPRINPTIMSGSPASANLDCSKNRNSSNLGTSNEVNFEGRLPPCSPYSQSLFSCELGASQWSLPSLPVVSQPKNVAVSLSATSIATSPAQSYSSNPFVVPYSQMPSECYGNALSDSSSLGLWSTSSAQYNTSNGLPLSLGTLSTPPRTVRPPPGLPAPPGFALNQPILSHNNHCENTPAHICGTETPSLLPATPLFPTPGTVMDASPHPWNGTSVSSSPASAFVMSMNQSTPVLTTNPFAGDPNEVEWRIEAELQELGGRMIGSVLDGL